MAEDTPQDDRQDRREDKGARFPPRRPVRGGGRGEGRGEGRRADGPWGDRRGTAGGGRRSSGGEDRRGAGSGERNALSVDRRRDGGSGERRGGSGAGGGRQGERPRRDTSAGGRGRSFPDRAREDAPRERPAHNPRDLRAANRPDQDRSPDIDPDVTGKELDRGTLKEIGGLDARPAEWVAKHLVMAGRYLDEDPTLAFQHALAASRKGGRLSRVREAVALTAYAAGEYGDALREFRTYRRMTGDDTHVAAQVDCERALGRHEKALQTAAEVDLERLDRAARVELAMVVSGVREDLGDLEGANAALQIPELDRRRGYPFSPRLFQRQADVLVALGRRAEAAQWQHSVRVAERALGIGGFAEPEIVDIEVEPADEAGRGRHDGPKPRHDRPEGARSPREQRPERSEEREDRPAASDPVVPDDSVPGVAGPATPDTPERPVEPHAPVEHDPNQMALFDAPEGTGQ